MSGETERDRLDAEMRELLLQLLLCSHIPAGPYDPIGRSRDSDSGMRPPGDKGAEHWLAQKYDLCETDDDRRDVIKQARDELKAIRQGPDERPDAIEQDDVDWLAKRNREIVATGEGFTVRELAVKYRCGERDIVKARRGAGREPEFGKQPDFPGGRRRAGNGRYESDDSDDKRAKVRAYDEKGYGISQIVMLTGLSRSTVERYLGRRAA